MSGYGKYKALEIMDGDCTAIRLNMQTVSFKKWNMVGGTAYKATDYQTIAQLGTYLYYYIVTPPYTASTDRQEQHFFMIDMSSSGFMQPSLYENGICSGNMTNVPFYNFDRNSANNTDMRIYVNPASVDTLGIAIEPQSSSSIAGVKIFFGLWVLDHDVNYILRIANPAYAGNMIFSRFVTFMDYTDTSLTEARA